MDRKAIQEQRKKGYFIEAAKKIIKEEGVKNLTVKKVADLAGFASGTLYNYFADLNDLYSYCARDFWDECRDYVLQALKNNEEIKEKIIRSLKSYCEYYINNPNVFELIFLVDFSELPDETPEVVYIIMKLTRQSVADGIIPEEKLRMVEETLSNYIHGLLLFYIKGRTRASRGDILELIEDEVEFIFELC